VALDWGIGKYEHTALELAPVSQYVVGRAGVRPGERALDLGCGTGNATLELARAGAVVTSVDPAERLVGVTQARLADAGLTTYARVGEAAAIPLDDDSVELVVSVFAVIFAPDPAAALGEIRRVLAPGGRVIITAWVPGTGFGKAYGALRGAISRAPDAPAPLPPFAWHDHDALSAIAQPLGFNLTVEKATLVFGATSPEAQVDLDFSAHPMWIDALAAARAAGADEPAIRDQAVAALREINEDPTAFRATSSYVIVTLH
jgi:SAM-dependent methyltransferase